jgi:D-psicose/D-tagatose/L-ribulose 3-epimerase
MRLAISNIAWDVAEDEAIVGLLERFGIDAIDIAPGKYFPDPGRASTADIAAVRCWWADRGIDITGMQSLLFGTTGLNLFGPSEVQDSMLRHLGEICRIGGELGATRLVFGSPRNRDRSALSDEGALDMAVSFFRRLGDIAEDSGVGICLEPNPTRYGANFMTTSDETMTVVERVAHRAVGMQLDTGALTINGEQAEATLESCAHLIAHVHASEPDLVPLGDGGTRHGEVYDALAPRLPNHIVSVEMKATEIEPHTVSIERALRVAVANYRDREVGANK